MRSKLIILGCGSSVGVPRIDGFWGKCNKSNKMINIVEKVLKKHQFKYYNKWHTNVGSIVVYGSE